MDLICYLKSYKNILTIILPLHWMWVNVEIFCQILDDISPLPARADPQRGAGHEADRPQVGLSRRDGGGRGRQREENSGISKTEKTMIIPSRLMDHM